MRKLLVVTAFFFLFQGCAPSRTEQKDLVQSSDEVGQALSSVPMSSPLDQTSELNECNVENASAIFSLKPEMESGHEQEFWQRCEMLYACSPTASESLKKWFVTTGLSFRIGFSDLGKLKTGPNSEKMAGLFISGTDKIYLNKGMKSYFEACPYLIHEITHRFDPDQSSDESLLIEFRAYYLQMAFNDELALRDDNIGENAKHKLSAKKGVLPLTTRENLMKKIAAAYGFSEDMSLIDRFPPLPGEAIMLATKKKHQE